MHLVSPHADLCGRRSHLGTRRPPPQCYRCRAPFKNLIMPLYCPLYQRHGPTCHSIYQSPTRLRFGQGYGDAYGQTKMDALTCLCGLYVAPLVSS
jgi:hypothetical protein